MSLLGLPIKSTKTGSAGLLVRIPNISTVSNVLNEFLRFF